MTASDFVSQSRKSHSSRQSYPPCNNEPTNDFTHDGWRFRKKTSQGEAGYDQPQALNHVRESDPSEEFVTRLNGRQSNKPKDSSVVSHATALSDDSESGSRARCSTSKGLVDHESPKESKACSIDSRVGEPLPNFESPEKVQPLSMSLLSSIDRNDVHRSALPIRDDLPPHPRDSDESNSAPVFQSSKRSDSLERVDTSLLKTSLEMTDMSPLNGKNPEMSSSSKIFPSRLNGQPTVTSDPAGNGRLPVSIPDELYLPQPTLERSDHKAPVADTLERLKPTLDHQNPQTPPAEISGHPQSILDETDHQGTALISQDHSEYFPVESYQSLYISRGGDHPETVLERAEHQDPDLVTPNQPLFIPVGQSYPEPNSVKRNQSPFVFHADRPALTSENSAPIRDVDDVQNYPKAISDAQSRSESIVSPESSTGTDQKPPIELERELHRLRWRSLKSRAIVAERRTEMRELRNETSDADAEFMKMSRESCISGNHDDMVLEASWKKLQALRDAYGPLEEAYDMLEERLDREEYELAELEESMAKSGFSMPETHESDVDSNPDGLDEEDPLLKEYMSKLGDLTLLHEAYSDLLAENDNLLRVKEANEKSRREVTLESETILAKFYPQQVKLLENMRQIDAEVERLRRECIQKKLLPEEEVDGNDILQNIDGSIDPGHAEYNIFPRLLARPDEYEDEKVSKELLSEFKDGDTGDRIARWLLHKLRSSCSEVELLARYSNGLSRTVDNQKWQEEVLYFWFMDSTNLPPSAYELDPTLTAVPSTIITDPTKVTPKPFGEKHFIQLAVRSSSLSRKLEFGMLLKLSELKGRSAVTK